MTSWGTRWRKNHVILQWPIKNCSLYVKYSEDHLAAWAKCEIAQCHKSKKKKKKNCSRISDYRSLLSGFSLGIVIDITQYVKILLIINCVKVIWKFSKKFSINMSQEDLNIPKQVSFSLFYLLLLFMCSHIYLLFLIIYNM